MRGNVGVIDPMNNPQRISAILVVRAGHVAAACNSCCRAGERFVGFSTLLPIFNACSRVSFDVALMLSAETRCRSLSASLSRRPVSRSENFPFAGAQLSEIAPD